MFRMLFSVKSDVPNLVGRSKDLAIRNVVLLEDFVVTDESSNMAPFLNVNSVL